MGKDRHWGDWLESVRLLVEAGLSLVKSETASWDEGTEGGRAGVKHSSRRCVS